MFINSHIHEGGSLKNVFGTVVHCGQKMPSKKPVAQWNTDKYNVNHNHNNNEIYSNWN